MAFTVTASPAGASFSRGVDLEVRVYTNATETGGASNGGRNTAAAAAQGTLTPNFSSSAVVWSITSDTSSTWPSAATSNAYDSGASHNHTDGWESNAGHYTGTVTASTPLTYGAGSTATSADHENWCAYEVPASGGTITLDASSPASVTSDTGTTAVTASFTPPAGSVLVALVAAGGSGSGAGVTCSISDTSGLSLVWTQRVTSSSVDNFQPTFIFTATVGAAPPTVSVNPVTVKPSRTWLRHYQHFTRPTIQAPLQQIAVHAGVATVGAQAQMGPRVITGLAGGTAGYFINQYGMPRLYYGTVPWGMPANAGRWNSGNWQADFDTYFADIAAQGFTTAEMHPWGHSHTGCNNDLGNTWDSVSPWTTLPTLNNTFWQRIDYLLNSAQANGITVFLVLTMQCDMGMDAFAGTGVFNGVSAANIQTACQNIATRYASQPNLIYHFGDDYNNNDDTRMNAALTGLRNGGYTGPTGIEYYSSGTTSREDLSGSPTATPFPWGGSNATYNWCYYYWVTYFAVEQAYKENSQIPVVWGDGYYVGPSGEPTDTHLMRNFVWWALASGARGCSMGSETILNWQSTAFADITTNQLWYVNESLAVYTAFSGLAGWWKLKPDLTSALVTAGRGTRSAYNSGNFLGANLGTDNYVAASVAPDKSLAVIYCAVAMSITIDQTQVATGYTATWVDPANGATQSTSTGTTYASSGLGNNSAGNADWVLVLQGPPSVNATAGVAAVSVVAPQPADAVTVTAGVATVTAAAPAPTAATAATAGAATVLVAAPAAPTAHTAAATAAAVLAVAPAPTDAVTASAGAAIVNAVALAPTVNTSGSTNANAAVAAVAAAAPAAAVADTAAAGVATALAAATAPSAAAAANAGVAVAHGVAAQPSDAVTVNAAAAAVAAVAPGATVSTSGSVSATAAVAAVQAAAPVPATAATVTAAVGTAHAAPGATLAASQALAGVAATLTVAAGPAPAATATAAAARVLAAGLNVPPPFTIGYLTASDAPGGSGGVLTASDTRTGGPGG